ncbi:hypothetical protein ACIGO9_21650 [Nocardia asteroides]|uniref:hypothetical protein n=1 Tax=Nocardia asteroides TaxID=1824 RepID=UPI0037C8431A
MSARTMARTFAGDEIGPYGGQRQVEQGQATCSARIEAIDAGGTVTVCTPAYGAARVTEAKRPA